MDYRKENLVRVLPIGVLLIFLSLYFYGIGKTSSSTISTTQKSSSTNLLRLPPKNEVQCRIYSIEIVNLCTFLGPQDTCVSCPDGIITGHCFDTATPVLGTLFLVSTTNE